MNIYISTILDLYDMYIRCIHFLSYIFLYMFHNQIIYIKHIDKYNQITYIVPFIQLSFHNKYIPGLSFYDPFKKREICCVSFVRESKIEHLVCKNSSVLDVEIKIQMLKNNDYYKNRHSIAKKYIFVEVNQHNITENYKRIGWSLINEQITVKEYKRILQLSEDDATLDLTDADNLDIQELSNDDIII